MQYDLTKNATRYNVKLIGSGKQHFFEVTNANNMKHSVMLQLSCDCKYMSTSGIANKRICSHIYAVLNKVLNDGNIYMSENNIENLKINNGLSLLRNSNIKLNEIRSSDSESKEHKEAKEKICSSLKRLGIDYVTEAIFKDSSLKADIYIPSKFKVIEIMKSESEESIINKAIKYNQLGLRLRVVKC